MITLAEYHKLTYTGLLLNFKSFASFSYKISLIKCLIHRPFKICINWNSFHNDIENIDQVYSNTRVPTQLNTGQHESDTSQHESTRVNTNQHESDTSPIRVNTSPTRVNTNQHEFNTSQHEPTRVRHESTQINTSPTQVNTNHHESTRLQHESTRNNTSSKQV